MLIKVNRTDLPHEILLQDDHVYAIAACAFLCDTKDDHLQEFWHGHFLRLTLMHPYQALKTTSASVTAVYRHSVPVARHFYDAWVDLLQTEAPTQPGLALELAKWMRYLLKAELTTPQTHLQQTAIKALLHDVKTELVVLRLSYPELPQGKQARHAPNSIIRSALQPDKN